MFYSSRLIYTFTIFSSLYIFPITAPVDKIVVDIIEEQDNSKQVASISTVQTGEIMFTHDLLKY